MGLRLKAWGDPREYSIEPRVEIPEGTVGYYMPFLDGDVLHVLETHTRTWLRYAWPPELPE